MNDCPRFIHAVLMLFPFVFLTFGSTTQAANTLADYRFGNTLSSSVSSAPDLISNAFSGSNSFVSETVDGQSRTTLQFPQGNGLSLVTTGLTSDGTYSIALLFRFDNTSSYRKIIDFKNRDSDIGLYNLNGTLVFYNFAGGVSVSMLPNVYAQVVLTRDGNGNVTGYVDGNPEFSFLDTGNQALPDGVLYFLLDDLDTGGREASAGAVARIRVFDDALSPAQVAALDRLPGSETGILPGDIAGSGDGRLTILDIIALTRILVGKDLEPAQGSDEFIRADANSDGALDVSDVIEIVRVILRLPSIKAISGEKTPTIKPGAAVRLASGKWGIPLFLESDLPLAGIQLTVTGADGAPSGSPDGFIMDARQQGEATQIILYSMTLQALPLFPTPLMYIPINPDDTGHFQITDAVGSTLLAGRTPVVTRPEASPPPTFALGDAYPNPFNPTTTISYDVAQKTTVTLSVYNALGQEIVRLASGLREPGRYTVFWNGLDSHGQTVASGVYLYRLMDASGFRQTRRFTLLK